MEDTPNSKLWTETEVAERLRCHTSKIKRLRRSGRLAHIPGRPVFIMESDLLAYLESARRKKMGPEPGSPEAERIATDAVLRLARQTWLQRKFKA